MTPAEIMFALGLVNITEGNTRLTDLTFHNITGVFTSMFESNRGELAHTIVRMYIWGWLKVGYELGKISAKPSAGQVNENDLVTAYSRVFKQLEQYDEALLMPIQDKLEKIDVLYANHGSTSLFRNMVAVMAAWMCEVGMLIARKPAILKLEIHYGT
jgi:hypothetical protein